MAKIPEPRLRWRDRVTEPMVLELAEVVVVAAGAVLLAFRFDGWMRWSAVIGAVFVALIKIRKIYKTIADLRLRDAANELEGCLHVLHGILSAVAEESDIDARLRVAVHVPDKTGQELVRLTEYVGDARGSSTRGKRVPANVGIIGRAYRERKPVVADRQSDAFEDYVSEMIEAWNYTEKQARELNPGSMSWMAVPIIDGEAVVAVLFLDTIHRGFFDDARQKLCLYAGIGIANFVQRRY